jgi:ribonuclease-3
MATTLEALIHENHEQLDELQSRISYRFRDVKLLQLSLVHSSFAFENLKNRNHNETQEFLGDAVLDLTVGYMLFKRYPDMREGKLTRIRSALVNETNLSDMARDIDLGAHLLLGKGEDASKGREKSSILSCAYEAMVGALFLDGGYEEALGFVRRSFGPLLDKQRDILLASDPKSALQEQLQEKFNQGPNYVLDEEEGPAHARIFSISVWFQETMLGRGKASSKKEAEQQAAREALEQLDKLEENIESE